MVVAALRNADEFLVLLPVLAVAGVCRVKYTCHENRFTNYGSATDFSLLFSFIAKIVFKLEHEMKGAFPFLMNPPCLVAKRT